MKTVAIYTDGACSGNPGPGGWAAILMCDGKEREISGFEPHTTNQRMELSAAIEGLRALKCPCSVKIYSDSAYLINAFCQSWLKNWVVNGWQNSQKKPVENKDLWEELLRLTNIHQVAWIKVPGHRDNEFNNRCDLLARAAINKSLK